jgi:hypothetical protein
VICASGAPPTTWKMGSYIMIIIVLNDSNKLATWTAGLPTNQHSPGTGVNSRSSEASFETMDPVYAIHRRGFRVSIVVVFTLKT